MSAVLADLAVLLQGRRGMEWQDRALCAEVDPDAFFPEKDIPKVDAKRICRSCDVQPECLAYAVRNGERHGIWGGLTEHERDALRKAAGLPEEPKLSKSDEQALAPCGTESAARRHYRNGEPLDEACRLARNRARVDRPDTRQRCPECHYRTTSQNHRAICEAAA